MGFSLFGKNKQSESDADSDELKGKAPPRRRRKSAEEPVDPVLPEKKRARRRLVGAAAMVLAAIIGLPMLMESEPQPLSDDVQIYIPSAEKPVTDAPMASAAPAAEHTSPSNTTPVDQSSQEPVENKLAAQTIPAAKSSLAQTSKPETVKPETSKAPSPKSSTESERIAQVKALLEGQSAAPASAKPTQEIQKGKFVLQVAALASADKVKELQDRLSKAGISTYTEKVKVSNGEQIRVRVGPFASREDADKMRRKLSGMGLNGMVVPV